MEFSNELITLFLPAWFLIVGGFFMAFAITHLSIPAVVDLARAKGLYDFPNGRTSHLKATPCLGGISVFVGIILSTVVMAGNGFIQDLTFIMTGLIIILFVGLKDDLLTINPLKKLAGQLIASGIIVVLGDIRINNFYGCLGLEGIPYIPSILFTIFVLIVIINGFNLIDGIDGLSSGIGIVISITLGIWFFWAGFTTYSVLSFSLAGSLIAFFYFNVFGRKNKIFLGDTGSLIVGLTVAVMTIRFLEYQLIAPGNMVIHSAPAVAFGILIIPLFDTLRVFVLRISQRRSPFSADRQHLHHILLDWGFSHLRATLSIIILNIFIIALSLALQHFRNLHLIILQLALASVFSFLITLLLKKKRANDFFKNRSIPKQVHLMNGIYFDTEFTLEKNFSEKRKNIHLKKIVNS